IWDMDMRTMVVHDIHQWARDTLGYQPYELPLITLKTCQSLVHPLDMPKIIFDFYEHLNGKKPLFDSEFRLACKDGNWKQIAVRGKVIERNADNRPLRIIGTINEITQKKK
ncbi:MAG: PAS domain-containing protein, partial [Methanoregula sp.]|nr:PAS domain-containing protein [Methanoregula sp.]